MGTVAVLAEPTPQREASSTPPASTDARATGREAEPVGGPAPQPEREGDPASATTSSAEDTPQQPPPSIAAADGVTFAGEVATSDDTALCVHARLWLVAGYGAYPVGMQQEITAVTDEAGRFELRGVSPGPYTLGVTCREAGATDSYREVVKTYGIEVPRDGGRLWTIDAPEGFVPVADERADEVPSAIAELLDDEGRPVPRMGTRGWSPDPADADANGDGVVSDEEWRAHDQITSYLLTMEERDTR